jgi:aryl-alcohol dehydrogenase-like predicted oxidoreductase
MLYGQIPGIEKPVSRLIQGTAEFYLWDRDRVFDLLDGVYALGGNTFDTAHSYRQGKVERIVGRWLSERGERERVVIISKCAHPNADRNRVTPFDITSDLYDSLARLQVDYIDLYLLHRDDFAVPVGPIIEVLNEHQAAGRIHAFGASNWRHERLEAAGEYAEAHGLVPFAASSPQFSLAEPVAAPWPGCVSISGRPALSARTWYEQNQLPLLTWSSMASGFFSGRFNRTNLNSFSEELDKVCIQTYCSEANFERLERAAELAASKGVTPAHIALAYVANQPLNIFAIVGNRYADEFAANAAGIELELTAEEMGWLDLSWDEENNN